MKYFPIPWQGFHHLALVTPDLDATIRFYEGVLGMQAGDIFTQTARGTAERHCFITPGETEGWGLHVFENTETKVRTAPLGEQLGMMETGVQHIAFALPNEAAAAALRECLRENGLEMTPVRTLGPVCNTLFLDNNGPLLEATWPAPL